MTKREAEDYRYGYQHIGAVNDEQVSVRKLSNCGGWLDLDTNDVYLNYSMDIIKVNKDSISKMKKPIKLSDKEFGKAIELIRKEKEGKKVKIIPIQEN